MKEVQKGCSKPTTTEDDVRIQLYDIVENFYDSITSANQSDLASDLDTFIAELKSARASLTT